VSSSATSQQIYTNHDMTLLAQLDTLRILRTPVLMGLSRTGMLGHLTGRPTDDHLAGSLDRHGARPTPRAGIVSVNDVAATRDSLADQHALSDQDSR